MTKQIGKVIAGGFSSNLTIKLDIPVEEVRVGDYLTIPGKSGIYYATIVDVYYGPADPKLIETDWENLKRRELVEFANDEILSSFVDGALMMFVPNHGNPDDEIHPVMASTIPPQRAKVYLASSEDMSRIFGQAGGVYLKLGHSRNQNHPIPINLERLVQRSAGVFGATGTGKSFLVRLLLTGLLKKELANVLVLDMHNEYSFPDVDENGNQVLSLAGLFPQAVKVYGLGPHTRIRGHEPPHKLKIGYRDITTQDVLLMANELDLNDTATYVLDALVRSFTEEGWLTEFAKMEYSSNAPADRSVDSWAKNAGVHVQAARALRRRINRILNCSYVVEQPGHDSIQGIVNSLETGHSVILSFGKHDRVIDRMLVGNVLSRHVGKRWQDLSDIYRSTGVNPPRQLVIVVEEAHQFLNRKVVEQTTFGMLAREMRKSYCTLLVIDQMPQKISDLVTSQLGTRFITWLGDEDDIKAVTAGLPNRDNLQRMIASLSRNQEAVIVGWGMPMPIILRICKFDENYFDSI